MNTVEEALRVDEASLVGSLLVGPRSPLALVARGRGWELLRETANNLERASAVYNQALGAMAQQEELHRGRPAREWRQAAEVARARRWAYAAMLMDQTALLIASGLGPDPVSDDEIGTGLDEVSRAALAFLSRRGLRRMRRAQGGAV